MFYSLFIVKNELKLICVIAIAQHNFLSFNYEVLFARSAFNII